MGYVGNQTTNSYTSMDKQTITGNGGTSYTLDHAVANVNEIEVFVNNVRQEPSVAYTVAGTALTMTGNVASSDDFYVVFQGKALQTVVPPDDSVTTARINDGAVTNAKIDTVAASKLTGALPAIDGSALTGLSGGNTPAFAAKRVSQQTANIGTATKVQFNSQIYDSDGKYDHTTNYRFTPTVAGVYVFHAQVSNNNLYNQAMLNIFLRKNGSTIMTGSVTGNNSTSNRDHTVNISMVDVANSTDYYEVWAEQQLANGSAIAEGNRCYFIGYKIA